MALLDELVQEEDLDPEVMGQTSSAFKNIPELEKIRHLIQIEDVNQFFLDRDIRFMEKQLNPLIKQLHVTPS